MPDRDFEKEAKREGWRPQEDWSGDPEQWVDAKTFVERGENIAGILKKRLEGVETRLNKAENANKQFGKYHKQTLQKEQERAQQQISKLEEQLSEAITNGDGQAYTMLNRELDKAKSNMPSAPPEDDGIDPLGKEWADKNDWYGQDATLTMFADGASDRLRAQGYSGQAYYDELTRITKETFPEKFGNPNRKKPASVDEGDPDVEGSKPKKKTYRDLDKEAKAACDRFVDQGFMTRDDFVAEYDWEEE